MVCFVRLNFQIESYVYVTKLGDHVRAGSRVSNFMLPLANII